MPAASIGDHDMITTQDALNEFLLDQHARMNSDKTITMYRQTLELWIQYAGSTTCIENITKHDMREYIAHLRKRDLARDTIRSYINVLRGFFKFVSIEYQIPNAMETIKEPKRRIKQPGGVKNSDFTRLFNAIEDTETGIRDRTILCMFADTGARLGAIVSLTVDSVDTIRRRGVVTEKGNKQHTIYWTHYTNELLDKWLEIRPATESDCLFVAMQEGREHGGLTKSGVYQIFRRLKTKAGVKGKTNPHSFRHNFAREYILSGGDVATLAKILNHKDVNMTAKHYAIFDHNELSQMHNEHSPLLKMLGEI